MNIDWDQHYRHYCEHLAALGNIRTLPPSNALNKITYDFSSNDYLQLSKDPDLIEAGIEALRAYGTGSTGSRLLSGNHILYETFEAHIAQDLQLERALLFSSGYQANSAVLAALLSPDLFSTPPLVFFDKLNHASLYQGVFLSKATLIRYRHLDMVHLESLLSHYRQDPRAKFIVTETLFGMDGDIIPIETIVRLAKEYHAFLYLDEAHAVGILGPRGYGLSTTVSSDHPMLVMGTLSKAIGCSGAYIAGQKDVISYIMNKAGGFIFSTALSPAVIASAFVAWKKIKTMGPERHYLMQLSDQFRMDLSEEGFNVGHSTSHIVPIILGSNEKIKRYYETLIASAIQVSMIRRPTVPPKGERLRITCHLGHQTEHLSYLIKCLVGIKKIM